MKNLFIFIIDFYQKVFSPFLKTILGVSRFCRFSPSCSEYTKRSLVEHGILKGSLRSIIRILSCQPFFKINK